MLDISISTKKYMIFMEKFNLKTDSFEEWILKEQQSKFQKNPDVAKRLQNTSDVLNKISAFCDMIGDFSKIPCPELSIPFEIFSTITGLSANGIQFITDLLNGYGIHYSINHLTRNIILDEISILLQDYGVGKTLKRFSYAIDLSGLNIDDIERIFAEQSQLETLYTTYKDDLNSKSDKTYYNKPEIKKFFNDGKRY